MIKNLVLYITASMLLLIIGYYIHTNAFSIFASKANISLINVYTFFGLFTLLLCVSFLLLYKKNRFKDQLGFLYLASVVLKIILFSVIFGEQIFIVDSNSPRQAAINLLIPIALTLISEVFFISKLLNSKTA